MHYGIEVWFHPQLGFELKRRVRALHYKAMRVIYGKDRSREVLNKLRAPPDEMTNYLVAKTLINIMNTRYPSRLYGQLLGNSFHERRLPWRTQFYDASVRKIGKQSLRNRVTQIARCLRYDWRLMTKEENRRMLKRIFLPYSPTTS